MKLLIIFLITFSNLFIVLFITLMERKVLGNLNNRKSINFFFLNSMLQSLMDFLKLISKKYIQMYFLIKFYWNMMIFYGLFLMILFMLNFPFLKCIPFINMNFIFIFLIYSLMGYFFLLLSYCSQSIYAMLAMFRVLIQMLSYEVGMFFLFLLPMLLINMFSFYEFEEISLVYFNIFFILCFCIIMMGENNRIPYDFLESETELVSGFNVEYMGSFFSMIFLIEYGFFAFYGLLLTFFLNLNVLFCLLIVMMLICTRAMMPRSRYDHMMFFFWKDILQLLFSIYLFMLIM